jgi:hypothetical protein
MLLFFLLLSFSRVVVERVFVDAFSSSSPRRDPILVEDRSLILERVDIFVVVVVLLLLFRR